MSGSPHRARNHNTPLKNEEQVSVTFEFGILKINSIEGKVSDTLWWSVHPGTAEGDRAGPCALHALWWKRSAPGGRAPPPQTSPESASIFRRLSGSRFRR